MCKKLKEIQRLMIQFPLALLCLSRYLQCAGFNTFTREKMDICFKSTWLSTGVFRVSKKEDKGYRLQLIVS